ncbi:MAG: lyase family protein [Candidatus Caldarchaeum sp.]|nr:lyase family protein [Candidatus Caldarchaeum sp.]
MHDDRLDPLEAVSPVDGRYRETLRECSIYFSEHALIKQRLLVELRYLRSFLKAVGLNGDQPKLMELEEKLAELSLKEAAEVKQLERKLGHDVVAATSYLGEKLEQHGLKHLKPLIHYGLTSDDVNNIAYALAISGFINQTYTPQLLTLVEKLTALAETHKSTPFLARTHGQPAVPTSFGSFVANYAYRLANLAVKLNNLKPQAKLGGAAGDLAALKTTYPDVDWMRFAESFVNSLGLEHNPAATQTLPHERMSEILTTFAIVNSVLSNLCRDVWMLGSLGLVEYARRAEEVHSSTMPQKKNPLAFENAEGALDLSASMLSYMSTRLLSSRLHRDLSDSIIKRFYGTALSLSLLGVKNIHKGLDNLHVNVEAMKKEVESNKQALMEAVQLILRKHGVEDGYGLAAEAAEKGLERLRQQLLQRGQNPEIIPQTTEQYIQAAAEKAAHLLEKTKHIISYLRNQLPR